MASATLYNEPIFECPGCEKRCISQNARFTHMMVCCADKCDQFSSRCRHASVTEVQKATKKRKESSKIASSARPAAKKKKTANEVVSSSGSGGDGGGGASGGGIAEGVPRDGNGGIGEEKEEEEEAPVLCSLCNANSDEQCISRTALCHT